MNNNSNFYKGSFELLNLQKAYYIGRSDEISLGGVPTHAYSEISCKNFDYKRFVKAVNSLVLHFDALQIEISDGMQKVADEIKPIEIPYKDISQLCEEEKIDYLKHARERIFSMKFDISHFPLIYFEVTSLGEEVIIHFAHDGIIIDGWSHENIVFMLEKLYLGEELPQSLSFYDYAQMVKELKNSEVYQDDKEYWIEKAVNFPEPPELPLLEDDSQISEAEQIVRKIPADSYEKVTKFARKHHVTQFAVMLTLFGKSLERYCRNREYLINIPIAFRPSDDERIQYTVGECSDFLFFAFENRDETIAETIERVNDDLLDDMDCMTFAGTDLIKAFQLEYGRNLTAPVVFTSTLGVERFSGNIFHKVYSRTHTSQVWIDAVLMMCGKEMFFSIDYAKNILDPKIINGIADTFLSALENFSESFLENRSFPLNESDMAAYNLLDSRIMPKYEEKPIALQIMESTARFPEKSAIISEEKTFSYSEMKEICQRIAGTLKQRKCKRIGIYLNKSYRQILTAVSAVFSGIAYMPIDTELPVESVKACAANLDCIITEKRYLEKLQGLSILDFDEIQGEKVDITPAAMDEISIIINTSGTTGLPKSVALIQRSIVDCFAQTYYNFGVKSDDCAIALTNFSHDMAIFDTLGMLAGGGSVVIPDEKLQKDPEHWKDLICRHGITVWCSVPSFMKMFTAQEKRHFELKHIWLGGETLTPQTASDIMEICPDAELINLGGPTETTIWNIFHNVSKSDLSSENIPYGRPFAGTKYRMMNGSICPVGVTGVMYVSGKSLSAGYLNHPEAEKNFMNINGERYYCTGDLGELMPTGEIKILGRKDLQVKINGKRIELGGIEQVIAKHEKVKDVCVVLDKNHRISAFCTVSGTVSENEIQSYIGSLLPDYMIPSQICILESLPLTRNGKIDRKLLSEKVMETHFETDNATIEMLIEICRKSIGELYPSDDLNFYIMGGDSISSISVIAEIRQKFHVNISITEMLQHPTLYEWAEIISSRSEKEQINHADVYKKYFDGDFIFEKDDYLERAKAVAGELGITLYDVLSRPYLPDVMGG